MNAVEREKYNKRFAGAIKEKALPGETGIETFMRLTIQKEPVADVLCNDELCANADIGTKTKTYDYEDMLAAFTAGRRHHKECADSLDDCWDFATWIKEGYGT